MGHVVPVRPRHPERPGRARTTDWSFELDVPAYGRYGIQARAARRGRPCRGVPRRTCPSRSSPPPTPRHRQGTMSAPVAERHRAGPLHQRRAPPPTTWASPRSRWQCSRDPPGPWLKADGSFAEGFGWVACHPRRPRRDHAPGGPWPSTCPPSGQYFVQARVPRRRRRHHRLPQPRWPSPWVRRLTRRPDGRADGPHVGRTITDPGTCWHGRRRRRRRGRGRRQCRRDGAQPLADRPGRHVRRLASAGCPPTLATPGAPTTGWSIELDVPARGRLQRAGPRSRHGRASTAQFRVARGLHRRRGPEAPSTRSTRVSSRPRAGSRRSTRRVA